MMNEHAWFYVKDLLQMIHSKCSLSLVLDNPSKSCENWGSLTAMTQIETLVQSTQEASKELVTIRKRQIVHQVSGSSFHLLLCELIVRVIGFFLTIQHFVRSHVVLCFKLYLEFSSIMILHDLIIIFLLNLLSIITILLIMNSLQIIFLHFVECLLDLVLVFLLLLDDQLFLFFLSTHDNVLFFNLNLIFVNLLLKKLNLFLEVLLLQLHCIYLITLLRRFVSVLNLHSTEH